MTSSQQAHAAAHTLIATAHPVAYNTGSARTSPSSGRPWGSCSSWWGPYG